MRHEDPDIAEVVAAELQLQDPLLRRSRDATGDLLAPRFREFGASGRIWDAASIVDMMATQEYSPPAVEVLDTIKLSHNVVLLTYRARRPDQTTVRSSIWRRSEGRWRLIFHQGTKQGGHS